MSNLGGAEQLTNNFRLAGNAVSNAVNSVQGKYTNSILTLQTDANQIANTIGQGIRTANTIASLFGFSNSTSAGGLSDGNGYYGLNKLGDQLQTWKWFVDFPPLAGYPTPIPWYYCHKIVIPIRSYSTEQITRAGVTTNSISGLSSPEITADFFLDTTGESQNYIGVWFNLISTGYAAQGARGVYGFPSTYKKPIKLHILAMNGTETITVNASRCFPTTTSLTELDSGSGALLNLSVTFSIEDVGTFITSGPGSTSSGSSITLANKLGLHIPSIPSLNFL